jgi:hypothetical protein
VILKESVEGCEDCAAEEAWKIKNGHQCGASGASYNSWCSILGESRRKQPDFHRMTHEPEICEDCGEVVDDHRGTTHFEYRKCASGQCDEWFCTFCKGTLGSSGPVDCPACGSFAAGDGEG